MAAFLIGGISLKDTTPIYFHSTTYAHEHGELDQYRASHKANIARKEAIEQAIADNYRDNRLGSAVCSRSYSNLILAGFSMSSPTRSAEGLRRAHFTGQQGVGADNPGL